MDGQFFDVELVAIPRDSPDVVTPEVRGSQRSEESDRVWRHFVPGLPHADPPGEQTQPEYRRKTADPRFGDHGCNENQPHGSTGRADERRGEAMSLRVE